MPWSSSSRPCSLVGYLWWRTTNYLERETDAVIIADTRAIGDRLRDFGLPGALDAINDRLKRAADEHAIYLLTDPLMTPVGGNLSAWPAQVGRDPGWYEIKIVQDGKLARHPRPQRRISPPISIFWSGATSRTAPPSAT